MPANRTPEASLAGRERARRHRVALRYSARGGDRRLIHGGPSLAPARAHRHRLARRDRPRKGSAPTTSSTSSPIRPIEKLTDGGIEAEIAISAIRWRPLLAHRAVRHLPEGRGAGQSPSSASVAGSIFSTTVVTPRLATPSASRALLEIYSCLAWSFAVWFAIAATCAAASCAHGPESCRIPSGRGCTRVLLSVTDADPCDPAERRPLRASRRTARRELRGYRACLACIAPPAPPGCRRAGGARAGETHQRRTRLAQRP